MEIARVVAAVFGAVFAAWGLPAAWEHWSSERRWAARIERLGKARDRVKGQPGVDAVLDEKIRLLSLRLASRFAVPTPTAVKVYVVVVVLFLVSYGALVGTSVILDALGRRFPISEGWPSAVFSFMLGVGCVVLSSTLGQVRDVRYARRKFVREGGPVAFLAPLRPLRFGSRLDFEPFRLELAAPWPGSRLAVTVTASPLTVMVETPWRTVPTPVAGPESSGEINASDNPSSSTMPDNPVLPTLRSDVGCGGVSASCSKKGGPAAA